MTEPVLTYKKGEGWVYTSHETYVFEQDGYRVTMEDRFPNPGEKGFFRQSWETFEMLKPAVFPTNKWNTGADSTTLMGALPSYPAPQYSAFTITIEKL